MKILLFRLGFFLKVFENKELISIDLDWNNKI